MHKLDVTQSAILGVDESRKNEIKSPTKLTCDGCGASVYVSRQMLGPAKAAARARGAKLYSVCCGCAEPFLNHIAANGGEIDGTPHALADSGIVDEVANRRRRFFAGLN